MESNPTRYQRISVSVDEVHKKYKQLGCLGHGGFGSVFLAEKRSSGRPVAIKVMLCQPQDESDRYDTFVRELDAVVRLNTRSSQDNSSAGAENEEENRDLGIIFFHEWFIISGPMSAFMIVMNFVDGGTLAQEIASRSEGNPYSERRIGWYCLQLAEALAFAHGRGVAHYDMKSANVLVDWNAGGRLVLADFGTSVSVGEDAVGFTRSYAPPELLAAYKSNNYSGLSPYKVDAFGLGCILFELVCCQLMTKLAAESESTLGEFVSSGHGVEASLTLPCVRLPFLSESDYKHGIDVPSAAAVGYSDALKNLMKVLLEPFPNLRYAPSELIAPFREDLNSPLLRDFVFAAETQVAGTPVTVDNIQLGMFVQRGPDWEDGDSDGGVGSIGVVVKLDADGLYTEVSWPVAAEPSCCRIGANQKFELQVGPVPLPDFFGLTDQPRFSGMLFSRDVSRYSPGQLLNDNCLVVGVDPIKSTIFVAPKARIINQTLSTTTNLPPPIVYAPPPTPEDHPPHWNTGLGILCEVTDPPERTAVLELFFDPSIGLNRRNYSLISVQRVQSLPLWKAYAQTRGRVASENWGVTNEKRLFHGSRKTRPETIISDIVGFDPRFCDQGRYGRGSYFANNPSYSHNFCHQTSDGSCQMFLARVVLGRMYRSEPDSSIRRPPEGHHSVVGDSQLANGAKSKIYVLYETVTHALPEYIITYKKISSSQNNSTARPNGGNVSTRKALAQLLPAAVGRRRRVRGKRPTRS